jgi:hypothetical protein
MSEVSFLVQKQTSPLPFSMSARGRPATEMVVALLLFDFCLNPAEDRPT